MKGLSLHESENACAVRFEKRGMVLDLGMLVVYGAREVCAQRNGL